jgi:hypothetical protein
MVHTCLPIAHSIANPANLQILFESSRMVPSVTHDAYHFYPAIYPWTFEPRLQTGDYVSATLHHVFPSPQYLK